jgi:hypothetical protein
MTRITKTGTNRTVRTIANRGQQYSVVFDEDGEVISGSTLFRRGCDYSTQSRQIYQRHQLAPMSLATACAIRATIKDLAERAAKAKG